MTKKRLETTYLADMKVAANLAIEFLQGVSYDQFEKDLLRQSAVTRQLEIIGEAANHVSRTFCSVHPEIDWIKIIAMRNILIHLYHEADLEVIWKTIQEDLPNLVTKIEPLLK